MKKWMIFLGMMAMTAHAHEHSPGTPTDAELGAVTFETSCKPQVAADINRGIALLHSFWHDEARRTFERAAAADSDCAMAWWGQALGTFHLYSDTPTDNELTAASQSLPKAEAAKEKTPREAAYISALHPLFDGYKPRENYVYAQRFADAMKAVAAKYPKDVDATAFYGIALARRYASIAPAAPHALHMPSHIFARLGLWEDDIRSNLASKAAAEVTTGARIGADMR